MENYSPVIQKVRDQKPQIIYLSGKTCTGKTTLARHLGESLGYGHIELDHVVRSVESTFTGGQKFIEIYRQRNDIALIHKFVTLARDQIDKALIDHPAVILEGALANNETLSEIVSGHNFLFTYLSPVNLDAYVSRILERFQQVSSDYNAGLPPAFWMHINSTALDKFYQTKTLTPELRDSIVAYAHESIEESRVRLDMFTQRFKNILVVEI